MEGWSEGESVMTEGEANTGVALTRMTKLNQLITEIRGKLRLVFIYFNL